MTPPQTGLMSRIDHFSHLHRSKANRSSSFPCSHHMKQIQPMRTLILSLTVLATLLTACSDDRTQQLNAIEEASMHMKNSKQVTAEQISNAITLHETFLADYPEDSLAPTLWMELAEFYVVRDRYQDAVDAYATVYRDYPDFPRRADALFMQAFHTDESLEDIDEAEALYTQFINDHPDHALARDAEFALQYLGMSDEELIQMFIENNAAGDSALVADEVTE